MGSVSFVVCLSLRMRMVRIDFDVLRQKLSNVVRAYGGTPSVYLLG